MNGGCSLHWGTHNLLTHSILERERIQVERKGGGHGRDSEEGIPQDSVVLGYPEGLSWLCVGDTASTQDEGPLSLPPDRMLLLHKDTHIHTHGLAGGCCPLPVLPASSFSVLLLPPMLATAFTSLCPGQRPDACPHRREGEGLGLGVRHVWI